MACYDCDDCPRHVDYGGKCTHFTYNCLFSAVSQYDANRLNLMRKATDTISKAIEQLKELDTEYCLEDKIDSIRFQLLLLTEDIDEDTEKEWNEIIN